ncbi:TPA: hypothetical protein PQI25_002431 [Staphylococcus aureus]|uniref:Uncharacterized protein n=2 Tax=Staphylococcus aureus TaxID=1280 RepID=A0AAP8CNM0_STAAU|nr:MULTISPECIES: hypothetical protein [Staphylococcaceae]HDH6212903.1 hypothetical protein [Staphylococcus aureus LTCF-12-55]HDH6226847.1 hypothetical protein [Staphylococcus aureus LTCF-12-46]HDH6265847.1 hypothetical protein [Staphylococcus aureus LTCF-7-30]HDH6422080.1 hypothetical protein [Staphylococcus aureus MRSA-Lux-33]HDH6425206.1 hypothetical protein [Staphylococcus aureus MRSA-Lux-34]HDH6427839.1 hypothetical protein [Staphylococcus aureus MRSA-Lux-32]HDH6430507.1 hypothetical pro
MSVGSLVVLTTTEIAFPTEIFEKNQRTQQIKF